MKLPQNYFENLSNSKFKEYLKILPDMKEENTRIITTLMFTFFAMAFFGIFAINPTITTIIDLRKQLADNEMVEEKLQTKINNLTQLQSQYESIAAELPLVLEAVPASAETLLLIGQVQAIADKYNLTITSLRVSEVQLATSKPIVSPQGTAYTFTLEADGTYQNMLNFVTALTKANRIIVVDSVSINKSAESAGLVLNLKGRQYFKSE